MRSTAEPAHGHTRSLASRCRQVFVLGVSVGRLRREGLSLLLLVVRGGGGGGGGAARVAFLILVWVLVVLLLTRMLSLRLSFHCLYDVVIMVMVLIKM